MGSNYLYPLCTLQRVLCSMGVAVGLLLERRTISIVVIVRIIFVESCMIASYKLQSMSKQMSGTEISLFFFQCAILIPTHVGFYNWSNSTILNCSKFLSCGWLIPEFQQYWYIVGMIMGSSKFHFQKFLDSCIATRDSVNKITILPKLGVFNSIDIGLIIEIIDPRQSILGQCLGVLNGSGMLDHLITEIGN